MAYADNSDTLRKHRQAFLSIALRHAKASGLRSLKRAEIAKEAGVAEGVVTAAMGKRDDMMNLVIDAARAEGVTLSY